MIKKIGVLFIIGWVLLSLGGCALYQSEAQYDRGIFFSLADHNQVARIKQDKLALEKLKAKPVNGGEGVDAVIGEETGFEGIMINQSPYYHRDFRFYGPETRGFFLEPNEKRTERFLPGKYICKVYENGYLLGVHQFTINGETHVVAGKSYHWFVYASKNR